VSPSWTRRRPPRPLGAACTSSASRFAAATSSPHVKGRIRSLTTVVQMVQQLLDALDGVGDDAAARAKLFQTVRDAAVRSGIAVQPTSGSQ
jgi:hypothetical protein